MSEEIVGRLMVQIAGDISALRQATEQANEHAKKAADSIAKQFRESMRAVNGSLGEAGRSLGEFSRGVKDVFGNDASGAAKAFGSAVSEATGISRESFLRLGEAAKATKDTFEMAASAARLIASPVALVAGTLLLVVSALGHIRREWRGWSDEVKAMVSPVGYIAGKWEDLRVAMGGVPKSGGGGAAAGGGGVTAGAVAGALGADVSAGLKEFGIDLSALADLFGPSKDAIKSDTSARKKGADDAQKIGEWHMRQWAAEQEAGAKALSARQKEAADWEAANDALLAEWKAAVEKQNDEARKAAAAAASQRSEALQGQILGASGSLGNVISAGMGAAGPAGAVVALLSMSEGFSRALGSMNGIMQIAADSLGVFFDALAPALAALVPLVQALAPLMSILVISAMAPMLVALTPIVALLNLIKRPLEQVTKALDWFVQGILDVINFLSMGSSGDGTGNAGGGYAAYAGIPGLWPGDMGTAKNGNFQQPYPIAPEIEDEANDAAVALAEVARAARDFTDSMTNMPGGIKVAARRYSASEAEGALLDLLDQLMRRRRFVESGSPFGGG